MEAREDVSPGEFLSPFSPLCWYLKWIHKAHFWVYESHLIEHTQF